MNERIRQLAVQAFFDETTSQPSDKMYNFSELKMQKFALLIVRETFDWITENCGYMDDEAWQDLRRHFGVDKNERSN